MSVNDHPELDRVHALMMAALDGECSKSERQELDAHLVRPEIAAEWERLQRLKEVTTTMTVRQLPQEVWDGYRVRTMPRVERVIGWFLVLFGAGVLGGMSAWLWLMSFVASDAPLIVKLAAVALAAGGLVLLVSVARERWFLYRRDPYSREVIR